MGTTLKQLYRFQVRREVRRGVLDAVDEADQSNVLLVEVAPDRDLDEDTLEALQQIADDNQCESFTDQSRFYLVAKSQEQSAELGRQIQACDLAQPREPRPAHGEDLIPIPQPPPIPPTSFPPPPPQRRQRHWVIAAVFGFIILVIIGVAFGSYQQQQADQERRQQEQRQQEEAARIEAQKQEESRQKEEAAKAEDQRKQAEAALAVESAQEHSKKYEEWLIARRSEMEPSVITVRVKNECPSDYVKVAIRFQVPNDSGHWVTSGWWMIQPGEEVKPVIATANPHLYFFAEGAKYSWNGDGQSDAINVAVVSNSFVQEDGEEIKGVDERSVTMAHHTASGWGEYTQSFTCPQ